MVLLAVNFDNLHQILQSLYTDMMPLCSQMTGVAKGLAGLGAPFYVAYRVWQSLARAEPIDVFPLLRPFALGICIMFFPTIVLGTLNSILSPVVTGTHRILETQTFDMNEYRQQKDKVWRLRRCGGIPRRPTWWTRRLLTTNWMNWGSGRYRGLRYVCGPCHVQHEEVRAEFFSVSCWN